MKYFTIKDIETARKSFDIWLETEKGLEAIDGLSGVELASYSIVRFVNTLTKLEENKSAILDFQNWLTQWCKDNGRKLTMDEYGIAMCAYYTAHPAEGPFSTAMKL